MSAAILKEVIEVAEAETNSIPVVPITFTVNVVEQVINGAAAYTLVTTPTFVPLPYGDHGTFYELIFEFAAGVTGATFQNPAVSFFDPNAPAILLPPYNSTIAKVLWANVDPLNSSRSFDYRVRALVNGQAATHDPTVQNDPPPVPTA